MFECLRCGAKFSLRHILFLSTLLVGSITSGTLEPTRSEIKATEKQPVKPGLIDQKDVLEIIVNEINETRFTWFDSILTNIIGPRPYESTSNLQAAEFIADELNSTGSIIATYQWFSYAGERIANVIGTLPSADPSNQSKIVVSAHFDTVLNSPGADDNGSGTALLLEVAKVLSQFRFGCTIEFVTFNAEEMGLWGSKNYTQQALQAGEDILLAINIDMCLWDNPSAPPNEKLWIVYDGTIPYDNCEQFADSTLETGYTYARAPIQKISSTNDTYVSVENWRRSDQASFWDAGIPALWIFEFNGFQNPYYHSPNDSMEVESYNFTLGTQAAQVVAATIAKLAHVDSHSPTTLHDYDGFWHNVDFTVTLTATDDVSGVDETYYSINGGPTQSVGIDGHPLITTEGANNKLEYWSVDNAGNEELHRFVSSVKLDKTKPNASAGQDQTVKLDTTMTFDASHSTDDLSEVLSYEWDFGDGQSGTGVTATHIYSSPETYTVILTVRDAAGNSDTDSVIVAVAPPSEGFPLVILVALTGIIVIGAVLAIFFLRRTRSIKG